nr:hypothetical protein [Pandoravirus belohorizontensis]
MTHRTVAALHLHPRRICRRRGLFFVGALFLLQRAPGTTDPRSAPSQKMLFKDIFKTFFLLSVEEEEKKKKNAPVGGLARLLYFFALNYDAHSRRSRRTHTLLAMGTRAAATGRRKRKKKEKAHRRQTGRWRGGRMGQRQPWPVSHEQEAPRPVQMRITESARARRAASNAWR